MTTEQKIHAMLEHVSFDIHEAGITGVFYENKLCDMLFAGIIPELNISGPAGEVRLYLVKYTPYTTSLGDTFDFREMNVMYVNNVKVEIAW
jgi:hypothetical protein